MYQGESDFITGTAPVTARRESSVPHGPGKVEAKDRISARNRTGNREVLPSDSPKDNQGVAENLRQEKVRVWPELVLRETIATLAAMILLTLMAMLVAAPLEELADPSFSTNPSKAPWYFLGLQELLVYFPPWIAGVAIPLVVVLALMAVPYLDTPAAPSRQQTKYPNAARIHLLFSTGLSLWLLLTVIGLFFRGPNWNWQWPTGAPLNLGGHASVPSWLSIPMIAVYAAAALFSRFRQGSIKKYSARKSSRLRPRDIMIHLLTLMGLMVCLQIVMANLLNFFHIP